jgi:hypothetical protein
LIQNPLAMLPASLAPLADPATKDEISSAGLPLNRRCLVGVIQSALFDSRYLIAVIWTRRGKLEAADLQFRRQIASLPTQPVLPILLNGNALPIRSIRNRGRPGLVSILIPKTTMKDNDFAFYKG